MIGREKSRHCQTWLKRRSLFNLNLQRKQNWTAKSTNLEENAGKIKSVFVIGAALWAEKLEKTLPWKLQELKKYPRKTCGYGQPRGHLIRVLNERTINDCGDFCLLWLVILKSAWCSLLVSETHFSCDIVGHGLWLAILSSLLCPETDRNICSGKQGYVFYFTDFKKWCFDVSFLTSISV